MTCTNFLELTSLAQHPPTDLLGGVKVAVPGDHRPTDSPCSLHTAMTFHLRILQDFSVEAQDDLPDVHCES